MNQEFINKYTPKYIEDFYIDDKYKTIIQYYINSDNINILFYGDSGTSKTTIINCILQKYYDYTTHNMNENIIYISDLKDNGFHTTRQVMKNFCQFTGNTNKKKTIVFDDLDNINEQVQQIIRHCIDKYNDKINFIGSCSNIQKILDNIQSSLNIIKLQPISPNNLSKILECVISNEQLKINNDAFELLIKISHQSVRNMLNHIYKLKLLNENEEINTELVECLCSNISIYRLEEFIQFILSNDYKGGYKILYSFIKMGYSVMDVYDNIFNYLKISNILKDEYKFRFYRVLAKYIHIFHTRHEDYYELLLFSNEVCKKIH